MSSKHDWLGTDQGPVLGLLCNDLKDILADLSETCWGEGHEKVALKAVVQFTTRSCVVLSSFLQLLYDRILIDFFILIALQFDTADVRP